MVTKELKNIEVTLIGCGDAVTLKASDTATDPNATYALDDFKAEKYMTLKDRENEGVTNYVPFHAVDHIAVNKTSASAADRPDPYGCEGGGE